jgi:hypothetical protein
MSWVDVASLALFCGWRKPCCEREPSCSRRAYRVKARSSRHVAGQKRNALRITDENVASRKCVRHRRSGFRHARGLSSWYLSRFKLFEGSYSPGIKKLGSSRGGTALFDRDVDAKLVFRRDDVQTVRNVVALFSPGLVGSGIVSSEVSAQYPRVRGRVAT